VKIAKFSHKSLGTAWGILRGEQITVLSGSPFGSWRETTTIVPRSEITLLAPVDPANVLCFGKNYKAHAEECGDSIPKAPLLFIKATTCIRGPGDPIVIPKIAPANVDYEAELAVVIGKPTHKVTPEQALSHVLGYTCANDVSARDCQANDGQWARGKSFDSFCPIGPWIETELDPSNLRVQGRLNGKTMQDAVTKLMIFDVPYLISYLSQGMTLLPGTVLLTGTPAGVGFALKPPVFLQPGDVFEVEISGIGTLSNPIIAEA
jgi:2-keto-4-pentenoate hydratase/2-oxohepta-3-ene-1,7-dioic acid hydratase in catechol pathway